MEVDPYTEEQFYDDLMRVTEECSDPDMAMQLVRESLPTVHWMRDRGVRWIPMFGRQAYKVGGKFRFWGGLVLEAVGGGAGIDRHGVPVGGEARHRRALRVEGHAARHRRPRRASPASWSGLRPAARRSTPAPSCSPRAASRPIRRCARAISGPTGSSRACAARPTTPATASRWRSRSARSPWGHWSGCHSVQWDLNAPWHGDRKVGDNFQKHSYPLGLIVNLKGERFVDEGADFRNYTYVKYGRAVIGQPRRTAFQIFDQKVLQQPARGVPDPRGHQGRGHDARRAGAQARDRRRRIRRDDSRLQRVTQARRLQSGHQGRQGDARDHAAQVELGAAARHAAVRGLRRDDGHHVHVRRPQDHERRVRSSTASSGRFPDSSPPASSWAGSSITTIRVARD